MTQQMRHRGPDDDGLWVSEHNHVSFGHRRLSIIDLSQNSSQPLLDSTKRYTITFNGEIYNYLDLKTELQKLNYSFQTNSDTEVLLNAYIEWGANCLKKFDGMFAFAIYDSLEKKFFAARDPFGEKPFYYTNANRCFAFASELSALSKFKNFDKTISTSSISLFLAFQYIPAPHSIFENTFKLPPGHFIEYDETNNSPKVTQYFTFHPNPTLESTRTLDDYTDELEEILTRSIQRRLVADVPVGTFLSSGIDSSIVTAIISKRLKIPIDSFTIGFADTEETEHERATQISHFLGTKHHLKIIDNYDSGTCDKIY